MSWESSELDYLFYDSEMCQVMLEMDQEYSLQLGAKNVLVSAASFNVLHWQRVVLKGRSLDNVLVYSSICEQNIVFFRKKKLLILLWSKSCIMSFNHWFNHGFSIKRWFLSIPIMPRVVHKVFFKNTYLLQVDMFYQILDHCVWAWSTLLPYLSVHNRTKTISSWESKSTEMSVRIFCSFFFPSYMDFPFKFAGWTFLSVQ